ncbi:MAG: NAD(P)/FAD-dependent oxidoreductase [Polyangiaceae bacterium]
MSRRPAPFAASLALLALLATPGCPEQTHVTPPPSGTAAPTASAAASAAPPSLRDTPVPARTGVVVVGAGLAGLLTAYELRKAGVDVHVLEATDRIGGRVATAHYPDGAQGEFGMQEVWEDNPLYKLAKDLGVKFDDDQAEAEQVYSSFLSADPAAKPSGYKLYSFQGGDESRFFESFLADGSTPAETKKALKAYNDWLEQARTLRKRAIEKGLADPEIKRLQGISFEDWFAEAKLPPRLAEYMQVTLDCELAAQWHTYSALFGLLEFGIFLEDAETFHAKAGNQAIISALAGAIEGHVTTSSRVIRVVLPEGDPAPGAARVEYMRDGRIQAITADRVVLAVPFIRLHELDIRPPLSAAKWDAVEGLRRGEYVVVHYLVDKVGGDKLWRDRSGRTPFPVLSNGQLGVIYGVRGEGSDSAPTDVFGLLIYGKWARKLHMKSVQEVEQLTIPELDHLWPGFAGLVKATYVYSYHPAAVPVWPVGRSPIDEKSQSLFAPEHGLYLTGDYLISAHSVGAVKSATCQSSRIVKDLKGEKPPTGLCTYIPGSP